MDKMLGMSRLNYSVLCLTQIKNALFFRKQYALSKKIEELKIATGKSTLNKIEAEEDDINFYSKLSEIKFGHILLEAFGGKLEFEPNIFEKTPD